MRKKLYSLVGVLTLLSFTSCMSGDTSSIPLYTLQRTDFDDVLPMSGITETTHNVVLNATCWMGKVTSIVDDGTAVKKGDTVAVLEDEQLLSTFENSRNLLEMDEAELERMEADAQIQLALLEAQMKTVEAEEALSKLDSMKLVFMNPSQRRIRQLQLQQMAMQREQLRRKIQVERNGYKTSVRRKKKRIADQRKQLHVMQEQLDGLVLRAPFDGVALRSRDHKGRRITIGAVVWNGSPVVYFPDSRQVKVTMYAPEMDYKRVRRHHKVSFTFDAMPENKAWGHVTRLSPVGKQRNELNGLKTFEIEAAVDSLLQMPELGMTVQCQVHLQHIADTLVVPAICIFEADSSKVVYVSQGRHFVEREVQTGPASLSQAVVVHGLSEGERIAMIAPDLRTVKKAKNEKKEQIINSYEQPCMQAH